MAQSESQHQGEVLSLNPKDQKIIKGAEEAIAHYHREGWKVFGISNQAGVAAGKKQLTDAVG